MIGRRPVVEEIVLKRHCRFMYDNFLLATQHLLYVFLSSEKNTIHTLKFRSDIHKYGSPNDETRSGHPLSHYGLGFYGFYRVKHSPWLKEMIKINRVHPMHHDSLFSGYEHYAVCFKDVMVEVISKEWQELELSYDNVVKLVKGELQELGE